MKRKGTVTADEDLFALAAQRNPVPVEELVGTIDSPAVAAARAFIAQRVPALGSLLASEHAAEYVAILRAFADFRAHHEPEPIHEDLETAVCGEASDTVSRNAFKNDLRQLKTWSLVTERIEKERLRGYRDTRRTKFRYRLCDDAVAFVAWLAEMHERDLHPGTADVTGNLLDLQRSMVSELKRMLHRVPAVDVTYELAGDVLYRLQQVGVYVEATARSLQELNLRLLGFVARDFSVDEAKTVVDELGVFLERFGRRFASLRADILRDVVDLGEERQTKRWAACSEKLRAEAEKFRHVAGVRVPDAAAILQDAARFYGVEGELVSLIARVNDSARKVWGRLNAKLRELERRNHRLEDLGVRLAELATLGEDEVPHAWLVRLVASAAMRGDPQIRPGGEKSLAPQPKIAAARKTHRAPCWITPRKVGERPDVASITQVKAERLKQWMQGAGVYPEGQEGIALSAGRYAQFADCANVMQVIRATRLSGGEKAKQYLSVMGVPTGTQARLAVEGSEMTFEDLLMQSIPRAPRGWFARENDDHLFLIS